MSHANKEWTRKEVESLISHWYSHECLWNRQNPSNRDRTKRKKSLKIISQLFNTEEAEICRKLHNLRNQFLSELKKTKTKKNEEEMYVSKWPYFKQLAFLQRADGRHSLDFNGAEFGESGRDLIKIEEEETRADAYFVDVDEFKTEDSSCMEEEFKTDERRGDHALKRSFDRTNDEFDTFGMFVANEIRSLGSEALRKKLKRKIQRCMLEVAEEDEL